MRKQKKAVKWRTERKKTLTNHSFLSAVIVLFYYSIAGQRVLFPHSAPFIRSPCFFCCPLTRPLLHTQTDTQTHPLLISKKAEPMKVNNCPLSWKSPLLWRWSGVGWVCASRANIITVRFPHVEIWSVQKTLAALTLEFGVLV